MSLSFYNTIDIIYTLPVCLLQLSAEQHTPPSHFNPAVLQAAVVAKRKKTCCLLTGEPTVVELNLESFIKGNAVQLYSKEPSRLAAVQSWATLPADVGYQVWGFEWPTRRHVRGVMLSCVVVAP